MEKLNMISSITSKATSHYIIKGMYLILKEKIGQVSDPNNSHELTILGIQS